MEIYPAIQNLLRYFGVRCMENGSYRLMSQLTVIPFCLYDIIGMTLFMIRIAKTIRDYIFVLGVIVEMFSVSLCMTFFSLKRSKINGVIERLQSSVQKRELCLLRLNR